MNGETSHCCSSALQILLAVLRSVFKHPVVEQWFLALELSSFPPHSLNPVRLKQLCGRLTEMTLTLLESSAATLRELDSLELISTYLTAAQRAVLQELQEKRSKYVSQVTWVTSMFFAYLRNIFWVNYNLKDYFTQKMISDKLYLICIIPKGFLSYYIFLMDFFYWIICCSE